MIPLSQKGLAGAVNVRPALIEASFGRRTTPESLNCNPEMKAEFTPVTSITPSESDAGDSRTRL